ncbi:hypothetical protein MIT9_P0857 [Methylomarinovum caldicuralii]|uniref:Uncharacterized protein n=1 Tax=Methylomarinovum caldicuralii TaxID=438856 RepID=A0AAU9C2C8_9GAMM|nr:hypothetical protein [Methylomarinovum caldicuralii]BCX81279.1 hypothetical protein MIT9_P0857 [Methylomarinovum caldicuralii]
MIQLDLSEKERNHLIEALESYLSDLRYEIADTDSADFRERLKEKKAALEKALTQLKTA